MAETHTEVRTFITRMMCNCGGEMVPHSNNVVSDINPPMYLHRCNTCGKIELYYKTYPCLDYAEIKQPDVEVDTESE